MMRIWKDLTVLLLIAAGAIFMIFHLPAEPLSGSSIIEETLPDTIEVGPEIELIYGLPLSDHFIEYAKVKSRQFLSDILMPNGVNMNTIYEISLLPDSLFNERKIKPGNPYAIIYDRDSVASWFVYEKDPVNYVTIRLNPEPVMAINGTKTVSNIFRMASGTIEGSLWESMKRAELNPMLAIEMSEIYAWSIDFFGLQQGDQYRIIYEESFIDTVSVGIHQIKGAWFMHNGSEFWAIPFIQDGVRSFFDENGNSLRKAFLKAPLRFSRISSGFSNSRFHPILKIYRPHHGVDYAAPVGTPVLTVGDGFVTQTGYNKGGGNYVQIKHNSVYSTSYLHLSRFGKGIRKGAFVRQGDIIGYVGSTGLSTGPHLDFRFYRNGSPVNPLKVEAPPVEPIHENNRIAYNIIKEITMQSLKSID